jgi:epoxyqueuosine reductase
MASDRLRTEIETLVRKQVGERDFLVGFSDLLGLVEGPYAHLPFGVTVALRLDDGIVDGIVDGPTEEYLRHYQDTNRALDRITAAVVELLRSKGASAEAVPATIYQKPADPEDPYYRELAGPFPHKTAATRAGLGWIGKTALFISDRFGPRVRLATVLTDHPLETGAPCEMSLCGDCDVCVEACPAQAATGEEWFPGSGRAHLLNAQKCRRTCVRLGERLAGGQGAPVCGLCVAVCPVGAEFRTEEDEGWT